MDYNEAVRLDPRMAAAYAASARLRDESGQPDRAIHDYDMALRLEPKQVSLYYDRGNVRREAGDWQGALADYDQAVALDPKRANTYFARGWSRFSAGIDGADFDARVYVSLQSWRDPLSPYMAVLAVLGSRKAGRPAEGERVLNEALANLSPRAWPVPVLRYMKGDMTEASLLQTAVSKRQRRRPTHSSDWCGCNMATAMQRESTCTGRARTALPDRSPATSPARRFTNLVVG